MENFRYPMMIMTVRLDGRLAEGSIDPDPKYFALAICDDFTEDQKFDLMGGKRSGKNKKEAALYFDMRKLRRVMESNQLGVKFSLLEKDPFDDSCDWEITSQATTNLKFYLSKLKYPPRKEDPLHIQFHFLDSTLAKKCDEVQEHLWPEWSQAYNIELPPFAFGAADSVFGYKPSRILEVKTAFEEWICNLGSEEAFKPYAAMNLDITEHFPSSLAEKLSPSHILEMLSTEKAFLGHIFLPSVTPDAPAAYAECK